MSVEEGFFQQIFGLFVKDGNEKVVIDILHGNYRRKCFRWRSIPLWNGTTHTNSDNHRRFPTM